MEKLKQGAKQSLATAKKHYQHIVSAVLLTLIVLIIYGNDLGILANEALQSEALSHLLLMPFFAGILFYLRRDLVKASISLEKYRKKTRIPYLDEMIGIALCLIAFLIYWYGSHTFYPLEYHILSFPIFLMGVTLILFNFKALLALILPILFLMFLVPLPTDIMYTIGGFLANFNTLASYNILKTFGLPVTLSSAYGPPTMMLTTAAGEPATFTIDVPCSGTYSLIAFAMFASFLAFVASARAVKKALVFVFGFLIIEIMNIVRITTIISIAYGFGEEIAMVFFHAVAGLVLIFVGMLITLFVAERFLKIQILPRQQETPSCQKCQKSAKDFQSFCQSCGKFLSNVSTKISPKFWTKILLLLLACSIVTFSIHAPTFAVAQGPMGVGSASSWQNATNVFPNITEYKLSYLYRDTNFEKLARQDASLMYAYFPLNISRSTVYVDVGVASSIANLHSWEVCLIAWQTAQGRYPLVTLLDSKDTQLLEGVPIIARYLVFRSPYNYTQITLYWYERATFNTGITVEQKYVRISLIILKYGETEYEQYEEELLTVGQIVASYWQPLKTQSLISLGVPAQQLLLIVSIAFVAFTKTAQYTNDQRKKNNNLKIFKNFASPKEKIVLQTIQDLAKDKNIMETREIQEAIKQKIGKPVKFNTLFNILNHLEEYGFIKKDIVSNKNKPRLVWKT